MKLVKPSKQSVLKGLLLLVVGLNFSWRPLVTEIHQSTMASDAPQVLVKVPDRQKSLKDLGKARDKDVADPSTQYSKVCDGKFITLQKSLDGSYSVVATNANQEILNCETCLKTEIGADSPGPLPKDIVETVKKAMQLSCDEILTDKEKEALEAKKKQEEEDRLAIAQNALRCLTNKKGDDLDSKQKLDCEVRRLNLSEKELAKQMKEAGLDKDEAKKLKEDLAKSAIKDANVALAADVKACKKSHKEDDSFDECDSVLQKYDGLFSRFSDSNSDLLKEGGKRLTDKLEKFEKFVTEEKKAVERVDYFKAQYNGVNNLMEKAYTAYSTRCDGAAVTYGNQGQNFDADACKSAYINKYLVPKYAPILKQITSKFTSEENKFYRDFTADSKLDLVGKDGAAAALAPFRDYTKSLSSYGANYLIPQNVLPQFADSVNPGESTAVATALAGNDLSGRMGNLSGARQFVPLTAAPGSTAAGSTTSPFAIPSVLSGSASTARYNGNLPTQNLRQRPATAGLLLPVNEDASIIWQ